tara:strand:- start:4246 stop:5313 length:1068 start_codon:yes stop_codon:yes gene_type:complete
MLLLCFIIVFGSSVKLLRLQESKEAFENRKTTEVYSSEYENLDQKELQDDVSEFIDTDDSFKNSSITNNNSNTDGDKSENFKENNDNFNDVDQKNADDFDRLISDGNKLEEHLNDIQKPEHKTNEKFEETVVKTRNRRTQKNKEEEAAASGGTIIKQEKGEGISSIFSPQIIIKEGDEDSIYFKKTAGGPEIPVAKRRRRPKSWMEPERDLWSDEHSYYDNDKSQDPWNKAVGNWNKSHSSSMNTRNQCGNYNNIDREQQERYKQGQQYQNSPKSFYPGYSYLPPNNWDVPQKRAPICVNNNPDTTKLPIGIADHGTPIFALEVDPIGRILATEEKIKHTNVGSILPKFSYQEMQ